MTECDRVRADAAGVASLPPGDPERAAAWAHAERCAGCARALREAERLQDLISECVPPALPEGALGRASQAIVAELRREGRRRAAASIAAVCASAVVFVAVAGSRSRSGADWGVAAVLWAVAVAVAAAASRRPILATAAAAAAAVAGAAFAGRPGMPAPLLGLECLATELASAGAVVGAAWLALRGGTTTPARSAVAAAAAAGALAGDAALQVTCAANDAIPHLLAFHVGGIVLAAAAASLAWRTRRAAAAWDA